jgi:predicted transcriptional regulator
MLTWCNLDDFHIALQGKVGKAALNKAVQALINKELVTAKTFGKSTIYFPNQVYMSKDRIAFGVPSSRTRTVYW